MNDLRIMLLDKTNAAPFAPYLLPQVRYELGRGRKELLALGAVVGEHTVGAVAALPRGGILHVVCVYVAPDMRRQGIGTALFAALGKTLREKGIEVNTAKIYYMKEEEDSEVIAAFIRRMGFGELNPRSRLFSVDTAKLHDSPAVGGAFSASFEDDPHICSFAEVTEAQLAEVEADDKVKFFLKPSAISAAILKQGSTAWVEDGHILGWILVFQGFDGEIILAAACKREGAPKGCFRKLMFSMVNRCYLMLGRYFKVYITTVTDHAGSLVETIAGDAYSEYENFDAETGETLPDWLTAKD